MRAGASLGPWDLVCLCPTGGVLVQVKCNDWPGTLERLALQDFVAPPHFRKVIHRWRDRHRTPDEQWLQ